MWTPPPRWLEVRVIEGLQILLTLRLRNAPAADTVEAVVEVWLAVFMASSIGWQEARDAQRIGHAFLAVAARIDAWPAPAQVLAALPPVPEVPRLPQPRGSPMPDELRKRIRLFSEAVRLKTPAPAPQKWRKTFPPPTQTDPNGETT